MGSWVLPTTRGGYTDIHDVLDYDGKFPVTEFIKYGYHSIRKKYVFYISPFIYDPFTRKLDLATSVTVDVETKKMAFVLSIFQRSMAKTAKTQKS